MVLAVRQQEVAAFLLRAGVDQEQTLRLSDWALSLTCEELSFALVAQAIQELEGRKARTINNNRQVALKSCLDLGLKLA